MRYGIKELFLNSKDASSLAVRVSWLKFEPRSRIFLNKKIQFYLDFFVFAIKKSSLFMRYINRFVSFPHWNAAHYN